MKKLVVAVVLLVLAGATSLVAQEINFEDFKQIKPRNIGPAGMSGRVTAIDVDLSNKDRIYIGTASGGVWLSENGGISWKPIFDKMPTQSIGALKINQNNPSEIWVGTGEGNPRNSQNSGAGVYKSIDGGKTWICMGLEATKVIHRILIDPSRHDVVYVGAQGSAWGPGEARGVYKTMDGGATWEKILYVDANTGVAEMVMDPSNPSKLIVAMWEFGRKPWTFNSGGPGSGLHITHDGGKSWKKVTDKEGLPKGDLGRIGLAIAPSKPSIVYALIEAKENAFYKSTDGGENWKKVGAHSNMGNRPFYYSEIYVDPQNENRVYSLWSYVSKSEDGGRTFDVIADYGNDVHPDHHAFWINPDDPAHLIDGNDGGLNISYDMGGNWRFINNLPVGQFYHVNLDREFPYNVYGGMQDNGSWVGPSFVLRSGGITNHDWQEVYFGDGFDVAPKRDDSKMVYAMSQGGNLGLVDRITGESRFIRPNHPDSTRLRYNWNAAFALDPFADCGVYYGSQFVHHTNDCGQSWTILSPDLTTNDTSKQHQDKSGGLTIDATNAENNTTITAIAPSPVAQNVLWVGTDDGRLHVSDDGGSQWQDIYDRLPGAPAGGWIPQIEVSTTDANAAFVVINNYRQDDWSAYLYHTSDLGQTWQRLVTDDKVDAFVTSICQDREEPNLLFLGTDAGLYMSFDYGGSWHQWDQGFPAVQIRDLKIQPDFGDLVIGTFGRAFWVIDDIGPFRALCNNSYAESHFELVSISPAYLSQNRSYQGIRFRGQAEFEGDNKSTDAVISLWIAPQDEEDADSGQDDDGDEKSDKKSKKKQIKFVVTNLEGDTVRNFSRDVKEEGLQRVRWSLDENGPRRLRRSEPKAEDDPPSIARVLPGTYRVIATYQEEVDSMEVDVRMDPRMDVSESDLAAVRANRNAIKEVMESAADSYDRIRQARKSLAIVEKLTETVKDDSLKKELTKLNKEQKKKLTELDELFFNKEGQKGIQRNPEVLTAYLGAARIYLRGMTVAGPNANLALGRAQDKTNAVLEQVEQYFSGDWQSYRARIDAIDFTIFQE